ncbi:tumor necrosis factor receptor superfamily member 9a [Sphaeramia orbicularis]|uniref:Tumor necrosis factor receptor superfamily member 9-like n=1 Tax=Sphaeramia orbicularis TaxID=375764 RepID=A0A673CDA1_9TELE|nr:tumor necrosis factor receptor superfamily member 9-like [Sphaeramia orbicularis]
MTIILWTMGLFLLVQSCFCSIGETNIGCIKWKQSGKDVCCEACHPGNRLVKHCGPSPKDLCTPCQPGTYTTDPKLRRCYPCTQCVGPQFTVKPCTTSTDTKCGCKDGLICGDEQCSFCTEKCGKGQEPTENRSCRPCPHGTFNDQSHQKCKPWSATCPHPDQFIEAKGDAFSDIKCNNVTVMPLVPVVPDKNREEVWPWAFCMGLFCALLIAFSIIIFTTSMARKVLKKRKSMKKKTKKTPIIRTPTDEPRTLIAVECSFHEAQQEQGSSTETLASKDSSDQLIP